MNKYHKDKLFSYIYKTTNLVTNKIYVGQRRSDIEPENDTYLGSGKIFNRSLIKHGKENFKKEILEICDRLQLDEREIYWINFHKSTDRDIGYNIAKGGEGGYISEEVYKQMGDRLRGVSHSKEHSKKIIDSKRKNGTLSHKQETKDKIIKTLIETNKNESIRLSHGRSGYENKFYKKKHSEESINIISQKALNRKKVECKKCKCLFSVSIINVHEKSCGIVKDKIYKLPSEDKRRSVERSNCMKINNPMHLEESIQKIKKHWETREIVICPHCNKEGRGGIMNRYHFDNCKLNPNLIKKEEVIYYCEYCTVSSKSKSNMTRFHGENCKCKIKIYEK